MTNRETAIQIKEKVIDIISWAYEQQHINYEQTELLIGNIEDIELPED